MRIETVINAALTWAAAPARPSPIVELNARSGERPPVEGYLHEERVEPGARPLRTRQVHGIWGGRTGQRHQAPRPARERRL